MRKLIGGLLGLCLMAALVPEASARTDARTSAQSSSPARGAASRQAAVRPAATSARSASARSAAAAPRSRATASRAAAAPRQATASRSSRGNATVASRSRGRASSTSARGNRTVNSRVAAAVPYGRSQSVQQGRSLRRTAMASCTVRHGRRTCSTNTTTASRSEVLRWTGGLAPAAMSQSACPDGTIATMAIGHNDITRCVPL